MKIYNTYTNKEEEFTTINENVVNMYVCGPTVNKRSHIGHMYPAVFFDTVAKYFKYKGYTVNYASNFTDVDDKIIASAKELNISEKEVAKKYEDYYLNDLKALNCNSVTSRLRVTECIKEIIDFISLLIDKKMAYKNGDDVYFDVNSIKDYGSLSNQKIDQLNYGNRIDVDDNKHSPYDFVLWKKTNDGIKWDSPFGEGRPGWHTECVVMINKLFKNKIDIHGGGIDLVFPHHENEIAQSQAAFNNNLASFWMHNGHITMDGIKMSKSLGNVLILEDLLKDYNANTIRIAMLKNHYRLPLNISDEMFNESKTIDEKLYNAIKQCNLFINVNKVEVLNKKDEEFEKRMDDDFNTSNVISYLLELLKNINSSIRNNDTSNVLDNYAKVLNITNVLGLVYEFKKISKENIEIYNKWIEARNNKDFENADKYRNILVKENII